MFERLSPDDQLMLSELAPAHAPRVGMTEADWCTMIACRMVAEAAAKMTALDASMAFGIKIDLVLGALPPNGTIEAMTALSSELQIQLGAMKIAAEAGRPHQRANAISSLALIKWLAKAMIENCAISKIPPGEELASLLGELLDIRAYGANEARRPYQQKVAALLLAETPSLSLGQIAAAVKVARSTVLRWKEDPNFQGRVRRLVEDEVVRERYRLYFDQGLDLPND